MPDSINTLPDSINTLLVIWFIGSILGLIWYFNSKPTYVFRTAIISYIGVYTQGSSFCTIDAIDDLGNKLTFLMKRDVAASFNVGDKITVTVPQ